MLRVAGRRLLSVSQRSSTATSFVLSRDHTISDGGYSSSSASSRSVSSADLLSFNSYHRSLIRGFSSQILTQGNELAGNAQPSLGSSYSGQNYATLCRVFGSKPVVSDILGTGLGTINTSNVTREEQEHSKAIAQFRALGMGTSKHMFSTISGDIKTKSFRPLSPHLPVYQPQMNSMLSIFNRISGVYLTGVTLSGYLLYLKMGMICLTYPSFYQVLYHVQQQLPVITSVTALAVLYHTIKSTHSLLTHSKPFPKLFR